MSEMTDETAAQLRHRQRVRDAMRKHGFTEVADMAYSKGDVVGNQMAVVGVLVKPGATEAEIERAAVAAAETYRNAVKEGPKP